MENEAQVVDALRQHVGTGVLGRMLDVLGNEGFIVAPFGINDGAPILEGDAVLARQVDVIKHSGVDKFYFRGVSDEVDTDEMKEHFKNLNNQSESNSGLFANLFSERFVNSVVKTDFLREVTNDIKKDLTQTFSGTLGSRLKMVSQLILTNKERGTNRDTFFIRIGGFDTHRNMKSTLDRRQFPDINEGIKAFYAELKEAGLLANVTFVLGSEFGRVGSMSSWNE
jgi:hypothetical protein